MYGCITRKNYSHGSQFRHHSLLYLIYVQRCEFTQIVFPNIYVVQYSLASHHHAKGSLWLLYFQIFIHSPSASIWHADSGGCCAMHFSAFALGQTKFNLVLEFRFINFSNGVSLLRSGVFLHNIEIVFSFNSTYPSRPISLLKLSLIASPFRYSLDGVGR